MSTTHLLARIAITAAFVGLASVAAHAAWPYPAEVSLAETYNQTYCTDYATVDKAGLDALVADHGGEMQAVWTRWSLEKIQVLAWDSSVAGKLELMAHTAGGPDFFELYDPGPWTPATRGWLGGETIDLIAVLEDNAIDADTPFTLVVGGHELDPSNTLLVEGMEKAEFLLGYNDGGLGAGDQDANEPVILGLGPMAARMPWCPDGYNVIVGTEGDDELVGTTGPDCIYGLGGDDLIKGKAGDDYLFGGGGNDELRGHKGYDVLYGGSCHDFVRGGKDDDYLFGGAGDDELRGWKGNDSLYGEDGHDLLRGGAGVDFITGGDGDDELLGGKDGDEMYGGPGMDLLKGKAGDDMLSGGPGDDELLGGKGSDYAFGGPGDDLIKGGKGFDTLYGGDGDDDVRGNQDADYVDGGDGFDHLYGGKAVDVCANGEWTHKSCESFDAAAAAPYPADAAGVGEQGLRKDGSPVLAERSNPDAGRVYEPEDVDTNFYSLGFGGEQTFWFWGAAVNGPGPDVRIWEKTYCCGAYPLETADVFAWDNGSSEWIFIGAAASEPGVTSNAATDLDLGELAFTWGIKVVDTSDAEPFGANGDAFDLNAVERLHSLP